MYTTKGAASFLGVSEASIRRWSESGLLPVARVGRRRVRRFREEDLEHFRRHDDAVAPGAEAMSFITGGVRLPVHSHLPTFYDSDAGRLRLAVPLLVEGLRSGAMCLLAADPALAEVYLKALRAEGVDVDQAVAAGQLEIRGSFGSSAREALAAVEDFLWRANSSGRGVPRLVGEMTAERTSFPDDREMLDYESAINTLTRRFPCVVLCQYDVRSFSGATVMGAIKAHPDLFSAGMASVVL